MTTNVATPRTSSLTSFWVTTVVALLVVGVGWLAGFISGDETSTATIGGLTFDLPPGWIVVDRSEEDVLVAPDLLASSRVTVAPLGGDGVPRDIDDFADRVGGRLLLFTIVDQSDSEIRFQYVSVDGNGAPSEVRGGRGYFGSQALVTAYAPLGDLDDLLEVADEIERSVR